MPDFDILVTAVLTNVNGLPEDAATNSFAFHTSAVDIATAMANLAQPVRDFYTHNYTGGQSLDDWLSPSLSLATNGCPLLFREIDVTAGTVGPVLVTGAMTLAGNDVIHNVPLPAEVSVVNSVHAILLGLDEITPLPPTGPEGDIHPRARHRGRQYIGPLSTLAIADVTHQAQVVAAMRQVLIDASTALRDTALGWSVWSRALNEMNDITGGWVDNEFDTQRRRGHKATVRQTWGNP